MTLRGSRALSSFWKPSFRHFRELGGSPALCLEDRGERSRWRGSGACALRLLLSSRYSGVKALSSGLALGISGWACQRASPTPRPVSQDSSSAPPDVWPGSCGSLAAGPLDATWRTRFQSQLRWIRCSPPGLGGCVCPAPLALPRGCYERGAPHCVCTCVFLPSPLP